MNILKHRIKVKKIIGIFFKNKENFYDNKKVSGIFEGKNLLRIDFFLKKTTISYFFSHHKINFFAVPIVMIAKITPPIRSTT